jgi:hypothetical protein
VTDDSDALNKGTHESWGGKFSELPSVLAAGMRWLS